MNKRIYPDMPKAVYFFGTCIVDLFYPHAGMAGMELLRRQGIEVIFPQDQTCCGQPAFNSGHREQAQTVAAMQLQLFPKDIPVVLPSGSCAGMMRNQYPKLFLGHAEESTAWALSERVFELTEFLVHVCKVQFTDLGEPTRVTWHGSCQMQREMGVRAEPKALLRQLKNVELVELKREKECCGFGGTFSVRQPEISAAMVGDKIEDIEGTQAETVVSGDCGCLMNVSGALEHKNIPVKGRHIAEFLLERIDGKS